jgi:hypothetical protein
MLWPLGWGVAGLITQGMISFMTDRSFLVSNQVFGNAEYSLQNLLGVAFLGVWVIFSTIAAPVIIQDAIVTGSSAASQMFSGAFAAGRTAATVGATTLAIAGTGASGMGAAGAGVISMASAAEAMGTASINGGNGGGSLIGSLSGARSKSQEGNGEKSNTNSFPPNDPTGDKTVAALIRKTRNPFSSQGG